MTKRSEAFWLISAPSGLIATMFVRYERLPVENVIGKIIDSSEWRLTTIRSHPPPQSKRDVADILSDTSGAEFRVFQDQPDAIIKTIAAGKYSN